MCAQTPRFDEPTSQRTQQQAASSTVVRSRSSVRGTDAAPCRAWVAKARLHVVGAVLEPIPVAAFSLILSQRAVSGSPSGSPVAMQTMLDFAARHDVLPQTEHFPMSRINEAFARLASGAARYRIVLDADMD